MSDDRTIRVRLLAEVDSYIAGMKRAGATTAEFGKNVSGHGKAVNADIEKVGRGALLMSAGMTLSFGVAAKAAIDWESAWAGVTKTVDGTASQMGELEEGLRGLARELPASHKEIAAVAEAAGQLGVQRDAILGFTKVMVDLGETTNLSADDAATSIAQMMNIMQTAPADVDNLASTLVALGNAGASTESEILDMAQRLAGAGKLIGASEAEVLALASAMANLGIQSQLGGGAMSRTLLKIYSAVKDSGDQLELFADTAGLSAEEFAQKWQSDPIEAVDAFVKGLGRLDDEGGNVVARLAELKLNGTQDRQVLLSMAGDTEGLAKALGISADEWERNIALQQEADKRYGTTAAQIQVMKNQFNDLAINIGETMLPTIRLVVEGLGTFADVVGALPGPVIAVGTAMATVAAAGLGLVGIVGTLGPKLREADTALQKMGLGTGFASRNLGRLAGAAGRASVALGVLYAASAVKDIIDPNQTANLTKLEKALLDLADTGKITGEMADIMGTDLSKLGQAVERVAAPSNATKLQNLGAGIVSLGGNILNTELDQAAQRIDDLDKALASLAQQDADAAASALEKLKAQMSPEEFERLLPLLDDYEVSLVALENAGRTGAGGVEEVTNAAGVSEKAISDLAEEIDTLFGSLFGIEAAADQFQQGLNDLDDVLKQAVLDGLDVNNVLLDQSDGALALRGHMRDLANDAAEVVQEWRTQGVTGQELIDRMAGLSQSFRDQAIAAGVPVPVVEHYLALVLGIPLEAETTFAVKTDEATGKLNALKSLYDYFKDKYVSINFNGRPGGIGLRQPIAEADGGLVPQHLAGGGFPGGPRGTDTIPAWLTRGEFVMRKDAVDKLGLPFLKFLNAAAFAAGGSVGLDPYYARMSVDELRRIMEDNAGEMRWAEATARGETHGVGGGGRIQTGHRNPDGSLMLLDLNDPRTDYSGRLQFDAQVRARIAQMTEGPRAALGMGARSTDLAKSYMAAPQYPMQPGPQSAPQIITVKPAEVNININAGDRHLVAWLRGVVRHDAGGDVQRALGTNDRRGRSWG